MSSFSTNRYDKLFHKPALSAKKMLPELEDYAKKMVSLGLLRISADDRCNFVILPVQSGNKFLTFTKKELTTESLLKTSEARLRQTLTFDERENADVSVDKKVAILNHQVNKYSEIPHAWEMKIARILAQSCHPSIFMNLVVQRVNIFISFNHTISDLLNVQLWKQVRHSQGLQSTTRSDASIFISTGGNPFFDKKESMNEYDGEAALTRLMTVAAQEIAHWAEIVKDESGNYIGRFSHHLDSPNEMCEEARQKDIRNVSDLTKRFNNLGLEALYVLERKTQVKLKYRKKSPFTYIAYVYLKIKQIAFLLKCQKKGLSFALNVKHRKFIAEEVLSLLGDMKFNLEPDNPAYKNPDPELEKAIMCAEALARVPQQEIKWGTKITKILTPNLYVYYGKVIRENIRYLTHEKGVSYPFNRKKKS